jgi:hypothetical protein
MERLIGSWMISAVAVLRNVSEHYPLIENASQ